jgi:hypothetical protein
MSAPYLPIEAAVVSLNNGIITRPWLDWSNGVTGAIISLQTELSQQPGTLSGTVAQQPTGLGPSNAGLLYMLTDYGHMMRWTGTVWTFAPGDIENQFFAYRVAPPGVAGWWQECDGTITDYVVAGAATITVAGFTTPNLKTLGTYLKSGAAYTGAVIAAVAAVIAGATAAEAAHTHAQGAHTHGFGLPSHQHGFNAGVHSHGFNAGSHSHGFSGTTGTPDFIDRADSGTGFYAGTSDHHHGFSGTTGAAGVSGTTDGTNVAGATDFSGAAGGSTDGGTGGTTGAGSSHAHGVGTLANDASAEPRHMDMRVYFRR